MPLLSKLGCNAGGCHGKASGQNGFKLSLFGFDTAFDYDAIAQEARGRRIFPAAPTQSLLLLKATGQVPHGGGKRLSPRQRRTTRLMRRWIAAGTPASAPTRRSVGEAARHARPTASCSPASSSSSPSLAEYSDGIDARRDPAGGVFQQPRRGRQRSMRTAWCRRASRAARRPSWPATWATSPSSGRIVPHGQPLADIPDFKPNNYVDELAAGQVEEARPAAVAALRRRDLPAPRHRRPVRPAADRATRRAPSSPTRPPTSGRKLIDRLLDSPDYPAYFALRWGSILRNSNLAGADQAAVRLPRLDQGHDRPQPALRRVRARHRGGGRRVAGRARRSTGTGRTATTSCTR